LKFEFLINFKTKIWLNFGASWKQINGEYTRANNIKYSSKSFGISDSDFDRFSNFLGAKEKRIEVKWIVSNYQSQSFFRTEWILNIIGQIRLEFNKKRFSLINFYINTAKNSFLEI
jgi:hypothetical protein